MENTGRGCPVDCVESSLSHNTLWEGYWRLTQAKVALTSCVAFGHDAFNSAETAGVRDIRQAYQEGECPICAYKDSLCFGMISNPSCVILV